MDADLQTRLRDLLDKHEIHETMMRYCRGVDRADGELIATVFHEDAVADHGNSQILGVDAHEKMPPSGRRTRGIMHFVGNELIEVFGDVARAEFYVIVFFELEVEGQASMMWRGGRYVDRWERRDGGPWKVAERRLVGAWDRIDPVRYQPDHDKFFTGKPAPDDDIYRVLEGFASRTP
ncbi:MAG TPA: nuclear transport factor 2 family protein [Solirubrobacteraceae bacterium]|nr:nuclear transport factor 2 family protein [Solirubrobacteraceae bacterium]